MKRLKLSVGVCMPLIFLMFASAAQAATVYVNCGGKGPLTSIGSALKWLQNVPGPSTIKVSGACHENVVITLDRVTLTAINGASITDASGGAADVLDVGPSSTVDIEGFTVNGGVGCFSGSDCTFGSSVFQSAPGDGITISRSHGKLSGDVIQNSGGRGLVVVAGSVVGAFDLTIQHCGGAGATAIRGATLQIATSTGSSYINNAGDGVQALAHSTLLVNDGTVIKGNGGHGIRVESASEAELGDVPITNNSGDGVSIGDLSFVWFRGAANISGNQSGFAVNCRPQFSATRGTAGNLGDGQNNCNEP